MLSFGWIVLVLCIGGISGHGYLADPPARSSAWLFDQSFADCCTYHDHIQMFCGGMYRQWTVNGSENLCLTGEKKNFFLQEGNVPFVEKRRTPNLNYSVLVVRDI